MRILIYISGYDGCGYYRVQLPAKYLNKMKDVHVKIATQFIHKDIDWADIVVLQKQSNPHALPFVRYAKKKGKKIVIEVDDCYFCIPTWNPAYKNYVNKQQDLINFYELSDAITVTTDHLAKELSKYTPKTYVLPNSLDFNMLAKLEKMSEKELFRYTQYLTVDQKKISLLEAKNVMKDKIVIGWGGSSTHLRDLEQATKALLNICSLHKDVVLVMMACCTDVLMKQIPSEQILLVSPVSIFMYHQVLYSMKWDIGICPIVDNRFNRSKSELKYVEFSQKKIPCVCSAVENYSKAILTKDMGLLTANTHESWSTNLNSLIDNKTLRQEIGLNAYNHIKQNFNIEKNVAQWLSAYQEILDDV